MKALELEELEVERIEICLVWPVLLSGQDACYVFTKGLKVGNFQEAEEMKISGGEDRRKFMKMIQELRVTRVVIILHCYKYRDTRLF